VEKIRAARRFSQRRPAGNSRDRLFCRAVGQSFTSGGVRCIGAAGQHGRHGGVWEIRSLRQ
jgi:hypothetical protein